MKIRAWTDKKPFRAVRFTFSGHIQSNPWILAMVLCFLIVCGSLCEGQFIPLTLPTYSRFPLPRFVPNQIILHFEPGTSTVQILSLYAIYGLREVASSPLSGARLVLTSPTPDLQALIVRLNLEPIVRLAEPNLIGQVSFIPNDPYYRYQWHLKAINAESAWNLSTGLGVVVAVLDTGVAFENYDIYAQAPDLSGTRFVAGWDFVNGDANPDDDEGHGTHITGTIAETTNNLYGCAGVAFNATIMPVKVMDNGGNGTLTDIVDGIYFAVNNGADVINMSFGFGNNPTVSLETAVNYAYNNGVTMVCSAGNNSTNLPNYPASYPVCISVSGVRYDLTIGDYSNYGAEIDVCAPGGDLNVDQNLDGYPDGILQQSHDGTSFTTFQLLLGKGTSWAAAHVSGTIALMQSASGGILTPAQVDQILKQTALDLGDPGWDQYYGYGFVNANAAVLASTQATIATAEALYVSSSLLFSSLAQSLLTPRIISLGIPSQAQSTGNPSATINGDLASPSIVNRSDLLIYSLLLSDPFRLPWQGTATQLQWPLSGYAPLVSLTNPYQIFTGSPFLSLPLAYQSNFPLDLFL
ncbi:MAG: S8 family peptidase [bacterium]